MVLAYSRTNNIVRKSLNIIFIQGRVFLKSFLCFFYFKKIDCFFLNYIWITIVMFSFTVTSFTRNKLNKIIKKVTDS